MMCFTLVFSFIKHVLSIKLGIVRGRIVHHYLIVHNRMVRTCTFLSVYKASIIRAALKIMLFKGIRNGEGYYK